MAEPKVIEQPHRIVRINPDGIRAITVHQADIMTAWSLTPQLEPTCSVELDGPRVMSISYLPDGASFLVSTYEGSVELRSTDDPSIVLRTYDFDRVCGAVAASPSGHLAAVRVYPENVHVFRIEDGAIAATVEGGEYTEAIAWSSNSTHFALTASYQGGSRIGIHEIDADGTIATSFDIDCANYFLVTRPFIDEVCGVRFDSSNRSLIFWETMRADHMNASPGWRGNLVCYSVDGVLLWRTTVDATLTGVTTSLLDIDFSMGFYADPAFSTDGSVVAVGVDGQLLEFDAVSGLLVHSRRVTGTVRSLENAHLLNSWLVAGSSGLALYPHNESVALR